MSGKPFGGPPLLGGRPVVKVEYLTKTFHPTGSRGPVRAVDSVSLAIWPGESVGLVGESGSGKTTLGRCIIRLLEPSSGRVIFEGIEVTSLGKRALRRLRPRMQIVFQDPHDSLNPRWTVRRTIEQPLVLKRLPRSVRKARVSELLELVRLDSRFLDRYPHHLSEGQKQRVGIARTLAADPHFLVLDEPTSALDSLVRSEILALLHALRKEHGLTYLFISHDLSAIESVCDRVYVMYLGQIVEEAPTWRIFRRPAHPYTRALLGALLRPEIGGSAHHMGLGRELANSPTLPEGCRLHPRCPIAVPQCGRTDQHLVPIESGHLVACMRLTGTESWPREDRIEWPSSWETPVPKDSWVEGGPTGRRPSSGPLLSE